MSTKGIQRYIALKQGGEDYKDPGTARYIEFFNGSDDRGIARVAELSLDLDSIGFSFNDLGILDVSAASEFTYSITNTTSQAITIGQVTISQQVGVSVIVTVQPATTLQPGASTSFTISVSPSGVGLFSFLISVTVGINNIEVTVGGQALAAVLQVATNFGSGSDTIIFNNNDVDTLFDDYLAGSDYDLSYVLTNIGNLILDVADVDINNSVNVDVNIIQTLFSINQNDSTVYTLSITPTVAGPFSFDIVWESNDPDSPYTLHVNGIALPPTPWLVWTEDYFAADPSNIAALFQNQAKTIPVVADGNPVVAIEIYQQDRVSLFDTASNAADIGWNYGDGASTNNINGKPVFWFDGTEGITNLINGAKQIQQYATTTLTFTMHMVFKILAGATDNKVVSGPVSSGGGNGIGFRYQTDAGGVLECSGFINGFVSQSVPWTDNNPHVLTFRLTSETGDFIVYKDGTLIGTLDSNAWTDTELVNILGASFSAVGVWLFYDGDDPDFLTHIDDLKDWFGIP